MLSRPSAATAGPVERNTVTDAEDRAFSLRARHTALVAPAGSLELGLLSAARWGAFEGLELSLHPLWFFILPRVQAKVLWQHTDGWTFSSRHEVSSPSLFLNLVAREGTGGLLDPTQPIPIAVFTEHGALLTWQAGPTHWLTVEPHVQWRMGEAGPILDFPFLYQRFAALASGWVVGTRFSAEGVVLSPLGYSAEVTYTHLPLESVPGAYAVEAQLEAAHYALDSARSGAELIGFRQLREAQRRLRRASGAVTQRVGGS